MSFIIALILVIVILTLMSNDKTKTVAYERKRDEGKALVKEWEDLYVDEELEKKLTYCISEKENYATVYEEVSETIANMEHWKYLLETGFPLNEDQISGSIDYRQAKERMLRNRNIARDIMLANRGKVSFLASSSGYKAFVRRGTTELRESYYEYAETILNILRNRGAQVELFYLNNAGAESYRWVGSFGDRFRNNKNCVIKNFDRDLFQVSPVPPIEQ